MPRGVPPASRVKGKHPDRRRRAARKERKAGDCGQETNRRLAMSIYRVNGRQGPDVVIFNEVSKPSMTPDGLHAPELRIAEARVMAVLAAIVDYPNVPLGAPVSSKSPVAASPMADQVDQAGGDGKFEDDAEKAQAQYPADDGTDNGASQAGTHGSYEADRVGAGHDEPAKATDDEPHDGEADEITDNSQCRSPF